MLPPPMGPDREGALCRLPSVIQRLEGDRFSVVAHRGLVSAPLGFVVPVAGTSSGRSVLERRPVHVADLQAATKEFPEGSAIARELGFRTILSVPLFRENVTLGVIMLRRTRVEPFSDKQVALLQTFADQAVIAIENVRLFNETKEALERQTATSEILGVISRSQTDVQPVFDTIVRSAVLLYAGTAELTRDLQTWVRTRLSAHEYPREIEFIEAIPVTTTTGKVRRADLRQLERRRRGLET